MSIKNIADLDCVWVGGEKFKGIGYEGLLTVNTKTYVEEPTRAQDGSMPNIKDHDTFIVPRCKVNFKYFTIEDYQRLLNVVNSSNEFPVKYWDKQFGEFRTYMMYCEPEEMGKLYNVGTSVFGLLDYTISFIGTLNNLEEYTVTYYVNRYSGDTATLSTVTTKKWGESFKTLTESDIVAEYSAPAGKQFSTWNTLADGTGSTYLPNTNATIFGDMKLYAQWVDA